MSALRTAFLLLLVLPVLLMAQVPTKCLEIESILVDACNPTDLCPGSSEGQNEMVRFRVGPSPIALNDLEADWPNNPWRGLVQNAVTAGLTAELNASIAACGRLLEPPGGVIPPGSQVLMVTSTAMCVAANPFTSLVDTIYIVFQQEGNTQGHFANNPAVGDPVSTDPPAGNNVRTLVLFHTASNCSDTAAYVREELVNVDGSYGGVGSVNDGATTRFTWPGAPLVTYVNAGCQAPIEPLVLEAEALGVLCGGAPVDLVGTVEGEVITVQWQGGTGTFSDPNALATTYTPGIGENGDVELQLCVTTSCTVPICTTILVPSGDGPVLSVSPEGPLLICGDTPLVITASGADAYTWSNGVSGAQVALTNPGNYVVSGTNACGTDSLSIEVLAGVLPTVSIAGDPTFCPGALTTLTAQGPGPFSWSTGATVASIAVGAAGTYTVSSSTSCGTASAQVMVSSLPAPQVSITGPTQLCVGSSITLTASGSDGYVWSTGATTPSISVAGPGLISVTGTSVCGTDTDDVLITSLSAPQVSITGDATLCPGESAVLTAAGTGPYLWNTGVNAPSITVNSAGTYTVASTNACGTSSAQFVVEQVELSAAITASAVTGFAPFSVGLGLSSGNADEVSWDLGDGAESTAPSLTYTYPEPGTYTVEVTVTENGCTASDVLIITVLAPGQVPFEEVSSVIIPNVITPNGDAVNDRLEPILQRIVRMELHIYNRWGQEVASLDRPGQSWDARGPSGDQVVDGTYFYVLTAWGGDGVDHRRSGSITVLR